MDSAISATPVDDRCIKSSTQPCNLHRQQIGSRKACTEELSDFQRGTVIGYHLSNRSELPTVSAVIVKWKRLGATTAQSWSGRPHKLTECLLWVLKRVARKNRLSSVATLTTEIQTASGSNVSTITVRRGLHELGFYGRAAAHRPMYTMHNAKRRLEWCKARHQLYSNQCKVIEVANVLPSTIDIEWILCICLGVGLHS